MGEPVEIAERDVLAILPAVGNSMCQVISYQPSVGYYYNTCCAKIPQKRATNRELSEWCAKGKGEECSENRIVANEHIYIIGEENVPVPARITVRKWEDTDWHEPTKDYLGIE